MSAKIQVKKTVLLFTAAMVVLTGCSGQIQQTADEEEEVQGSEEVEAGEGMMQIMIDGTDYEVALDENETVTDIMGRLPLELDMERYADHEYYAELPFTPVFDENRTSQIQAGHVYYWDGWNAFVINYIDWDIAPYEVVHIGEITDASVSDMLAESEDTISVHVIE